MTKIDYLYHLGLDSTMNLKKIFHGIEVVIMGGSKERAFKIAKSISSLEMVSDKTTPIIRPIGKTDRYVLYKVGKYLSVSHGMGAPSISILLHELYKLLFIHAELNNVRFIRIGTCGGIGIKPGSIVLSDECVNEKGEPNYEIVVMGKQVSRSTKMVNKEIIDEMYKISNDHGLPTIIGKTMACNDFYESQCRLDGAFCDYNKSDQRKYLMKLYRQNIRCIEMEGVAFTSFCHKMNITCCLMTTVLIDRLNTDQISKCLNIDNALTLLLKYIEKNK